MYKYIDEKGQHLHTMDGRPLVGTSTALKVLAKVLTWWASGLACAHLGWSKKRENTEEARKTRAEARLKTIKGMTTEQYLETLDTAYKAHTVKLDSSADKGIELHAELERFVKWKMKSQERGLEEEAVGFSPRIAPFIEWTNKNVERFIASEAHCFSIEFWLGGICDCIARLKNGTIAIVDFKSAKIAYEDHFLQCAGYAIQIDENGICDRNGENTRKLGEKIGELVVFPFGAKTVAAHTRLDVERLKTGYKHVVALYKLIILKQ